MHNLIPKPASLITSAGAFTLSAATKIIASNAEVFAIGQLLADYVEQHTKLKLAVMDDDQGSGNIHLKLNADTSLGDEGSPLPQLLCLRSVEKLFDLPPTLGSHLLPCSCSILRWPVRQLIAQSSEVFT
jgi:hypothetical protein